MTYESEMSQVVSVSASEWDEGSFSADGLINSLALAMEARREDAGVKSAASRVIRTV